MLFINDEQPELFERNLITDERVSSNDDVDLALCQSLEGCPLLFLGFKARQAFDHDRPSRKSVLKRLMMLLSEECGRH